nr:unnamed protein product [Spirometra erinaceieuropaei]
MAGKKRKIKNGPGKSKTLSAAKMPKKKRIQVQDETDDPPTEEPPTACILLPTAPCFLKRPFNGEPPSSRTTLRIEKMAQKVFGSAGLQPSKLSVIHCNHPLVLAEFDSSFDIRRRALVESRMREIIASFVQPRAKPPVPKPAELAKLLPPDKQEYCLNITNIPFSTSQEQLEENFPTAEHVIMRRRKDGKSKGSCMLSFSSADDCKAVLDACRHKEIDGRRITCSLGTSEELSALIAETIARGLPKRKVDLEGCQLKLFNVPYDTSERELKKLFPQARHIFFPEVNGSPTGDNQEGQNDEEGRSRREDKGQTPQEWKPKVTQC